MLVCAPILGTLWYFLAPRVALRKVEGGLSFVDAQPSGFIAADSVFALLALVLGLVAAIVVWRSLAPPRGWTLSLGLALGGVVASILAWRIGLAWQPTNLIDLAQGLPLGSVSNAPIKLEAPGFLVALPIAATSAIAIALAWSEDPR